MSSPSSPTSSLSLACERVLREGSLEAKLAPLPAPGAGEPDRPALHIAAPARDEGLAFAASSEALPRPAALAERGARAACLARFAHHELMAVELFAWALLRWPDLPRPCLRDFAQILAEEQHHCRLYLERLRDQGWDFAAFQHSDYFWRHVARVETPAAFVAAMGLTLEQANLDFSLRFADAFRSAGDEASAEVLERVHRDEVRHVESAARWLRHFDPASENDIARYERAVPFPLSAARAKGRPFRAEPRRRAGLEESFIEHVRHARSSQERSGRRR